MFFPKPQSRINIFSQNLRLLCFFELFVNVFCWRLLIKVILFLVLLSNLLARFTSLLVFFFSSHHCSLKMNISGVLGSYHLLFVRSWSAHKLLIFVSVHPWVACVHPSSPLSYLSCPSLSFSSSIICPSLFDASRPFLLFGFAFL